MLGVVMLPLAGFNWLIDPYGVFGAPEIEGVNRIKYGINNHLRLAKAHAVLREKPRTVILGSSRAESSFDPQHPDFRNRPVYNLALSGAGLYELYRYLQHAQGSQPLAEAVLALDFYMFNSDWPVQVDFDEQRLTVSADGRSNRALPGSRLALLLSWDALKDSLDSLRRQSAPGISYDTDGLREERYDIPAILNGGGHREAFIANEEYFLRYGYTPKSRGYTFADSRTGKDSFEWLKRILEHCRVHGIRLTVLINPVHARQYETIRAAGLWPQFEDWKRRLTEVFAEDASAHGLEPYALWDFGRYNALTTEAVPAAGDATTTMRWYRESSHFTRELGQLVLGQALTGKPPPAPLPADLGVRFDASNVEAILARMREDQAKWAADHPQDVMEIRDAAARVSRR